MSGKGDSYKSYYGPYARGHGRQQPSRGFMVQVAKPGTADATLTVSLPKPIKWFDYRLSWEHHNPEFICRVSGSPLEPDLEEDGDWVTFLKPSQTSNGDSLVIDAIADGFQPPEAVRDWESTNQANLNAVYPPGPQVDPSVKKGPYHSRDWDDFSQDASKFTLPPTTLGGGTRGGAWWPPKPTFKVTFMPEVKDEYRGRLYPYGLKYPDVLELIANSSALGWHVDRGAVDAEHTNSDTGHKFTYGWRCTARIAWYASNWREYGAGSIHIPPYAYGSAREITSHFSEEFGSSFERCPDGRRNAWEVTVPNGVYMVTASFDNSAHFRSTCTFENVRAPATDLGKGEERTIERSREKEREIERDRERSSESEREEANSRIVII